MFVLGAASVVVVSTIDHVRYGDIVVRGGELFGNANAGGVSGCVHLLLNWVVACRNCTILVLIVCHQFFAESILSLKSQVSQHYCLCVIIDRSTFLPRHLSVTKSGHVPLEIAHELPRGFLLCQCGRLNFGENVQRDRIRV